MTDRLIIDGRNEQKPQPKTEKPYRGCEICEQKMRADERAKMFLKLAKLEDNMFYDLDYFRQNTLSEAQEKDFEKLIRKIEKSWAELKKVTK